MSLSSMTVKSMPDFKSYLSAEEIQVFFFQISLKKKSLFKVLWILKKSNLYLKAGIFGHIFSNTNLFISKIGLESLHNLLNTASYLYLTNTIQKLTHLMCFPELQDFQHHLKPGRGRAVDLGSSDGLLPQAGVLSVPPSHASISWPPDLKAPTLLADCFGTGSIRAESCGWHSG